MPRTTSFQLGDELSAYIEAQVASGSYASASELVRAALQRMREEDEKEAWIEKELADAERELDARTPEQREHYSLENVKARFYARHPELSVRRTRRRAAP